MFNRYVDQIAEDNDPAFEIFMRRSKKYNTIKEAIDSGSYFATDKIQMHFDTEKSQ
ncbi:MAG: hypothetical protein AB7T22_14970 [Calditrichaceae bacterium]